MSDRLDRANEPAKETGVLSDDFDEVIVGESFEGFVHPTNDENDGAPERFDSFDARVEGGALGGGD
jgi:hypothetical protein